MVTRTQWWLAACSLLVALGLIAYPIQQPLDDRAALDREVQEISARPFDRNPDLPLIVLTGSSSVRLWADADRAFPQAQVLNTGFGGSTMDALLDHYPALIGQYRPDQVYIGSGDNDLAQGRTPEQVQTNLRHLLNQIHQDLPEAKVVVVAAKPSLRRWHLRSAYEELNARFAALAAADAKVSYADVWTPLLTMDGNIRSDIYASDGLHLNDRGYRLYARQLAALAITGSGPRT